MKNIDISKLNFYSQMNLGDEANKYNVIDALKNLKDFFDTHIKNHDANEDVQKIDQVLNYILYEDTKIEDKDKYPELDFFRATVLGSILPNNTESAQAIKEDSIKPFLKGELNEDKLNTLSLALSTPNEYSSYIAEQQSILDLFSSKYVKAGMLNCSQEVFETLSKIIKPPSLQLSLTRMKEQSFQIQDGYTNIDTQLENGTVIAGIVSVIAQSQTLSATEVLDKYLISLYDAQNMSNIKNDKETLILKLLCQIKENKPQYFVES